jgi:hypothetical protein
MVITKSKIMKFKLSIIGVLILCLNSAGQGILDGFVKNKGEGVVVFALAYERSDTYIAGTDRELELPRDIVASGFFAAYSPIKNLEVVGSLPLLNGQLQDGALHLKYRAIENISLGNHLNGSVLLGLGHSLPLSDYATETQSAIGQQAQITSLRIINQWIIGSNYFLQVQSGYNYSHSLAPSSIPLIIKMGAFRDKYYFDVWLEKQEAQGGKDYKGAGALKANSLQELGVSYAKIGGTLYRKLNESWGLSGSFGQVLGGRNIGLATSLSAGLIYNFKNN